MKKITIIVSIILVVSVVVFAKGKSFTGRLIFVGKDYIEVKYGKTEKVFYIQEKSVFIKNNANATFADLEPCQIVKVAYTAGGNKLNIIRCEIIKQSDCK
ncbi:MAG TPA: hypothetical protein PLV81_15345 [Spirochaetota bacterium]|nr:hypothetical protein [Spirochaetota bacterium]